MTEKGLRSAICYLFWWINIITSFEDAIADQLLFRSSTSFVAIMDMNGFRGSIEFHSNPAKSPFQEVLMRVNIIGLSEDDKLTWSIKENPTDLTQEDPCNDEKLGKELVSLTRKYGYIRTGREILVRDTFGVLNAYKLFERTLVIKSIQYALKACTLIRSSIPVRTLEARFLSPVGGVFVVRHFPKISMGVRTKLYWTSSDVATVQHHTKLHWSLVKIRDDVTHQDIQEAAFHQWSCSYLWELIASDRTWPLFVSTKPESMISVGNSATNPSTYIVETTFPSLEDLDLVNLWVVLQKSYDEFVACAPLLEVHPRDALAEFKQSQHVTGFMHFYQASGYGDATIITMNISIPKRNGAGFGIDNLSLWPRSSGLRQQCLDLSLSFFNPLKVDSEASPLPLEGTTDRYPIGDLTGKMGSLLDKNEYYKTFYNQHATLYGSNSLVGRSIVIYEDSWYPLACSNLQTGHEEIVAMAIYRGQLDGHVIFRQRMEGPLGPDTSIHINLRHRELANFTKNHKWKIHSFLPQPHRLSRRQQQGRRKQQGRRSKARKVCVANAESLYNPYGIELSSARYDCKCNPSTSVRCALGDLSNRFGTIDIQQSSQSAEIMGNQLANGQLFVDSGLFLNGDFSMLGLGLVIYKADYEDEPLDCATIEQITTT